MLVLPAPSCLAADTYPPATFFQFDREESNDNDKVIRKRIEALPNKFELPLFCAPRVHLPSQLINFTEENRDHWFEKPMIITLTIGQSMSAQFLICRLIGQRCRIGKHYGVSEDLSPQGARRIYTSQK